MVLTWMTFADDRSGLTVPDSLSVRICVMRFPTPIRRRRSHDSGHDTDDLHPTNLWMTRDAKISLAEMLAAVKS
jgi:hypothetical protein